MQYQTRRPSPRRHLAPRRAVLAAGLGRADQAPGR